MAALTHGDVNLQEKQIRIVDLISRRFSDLSRWIEVVRYEDFVADPVHLLTACQVSASASGPGVAVRPANSVMYETTAEDVACDAHIRALAADGGVPALCRFYPGYAQVRV